MNSLTLKFDPAPDDDVGRLYVAVETGDFSGRSFCWATPRMVAEFARSLDIYPIKTEATPSLREGNNECVGDDLIVGVDIRPMDSLGNLLVEVELANQSDQAHRLKTSFRTAYAELADFRQAIINMMRGEVAAAVLVGNL